MTIGPKSESSNTGKSIPADSSRRVVTFYSYKGGVGRSMALANIALLLARDHGLKVIAVDWDLEAPGLHRYFDLSDKEVGDGVIDYLQNYKVIVRDKKHKISAEDLSIEPHLQKIDTFLSGGSIRLLGAGSQRDKAKYVEMVQGFDWDNFYREWNGAQVIEALREEFKSLADVTLIDSRTGITDVGGVCTLQLPDIVVLVYAFNEQNLGGIDQIARQLTNSEHPTLRALNRRPDLLFLPSRSETSDIRRLREWEKKAVTRFTPYCDTPAVRSAYGDVETYLRKMAIPYVTYFAYGEEMAAKFSKGIGVEITEALERLISFLLGQEHKSSLSAVQEAAPRYLRRAIVWLSAVGIVVIGFLVAVALLVSWFRTTYGLLINSDEIKQVFLGGGSGVLGGFLSSLMSLRAKLRETSGKLSTRSAMFRFLVDILGSGLLGIIAGVSLPAGEYNLLIYFFIGLAWPSVSEKLMVIVKAAVSSDSGK